MGRVQRRKQKLADIVQDADGKPVYVGEEYALAGDGRGQKRRFGAILATLAACVIASGCIDAAGANSAYYVILPLIGEVSALFILCWNAVKVLFADRLRRYTHEAAGRLIPGACRVLTVFALFGLIAAASHLLRFGLGTQPVKSLAYPVLKLLAAALAERCGRFYRGLEWEKQ